MQITSVMVVILTSGAWSLGASSTVSVDEQKRQSCHAWEHLPPPKPTLCLEIVPGNDQRALQFSLEA